MDKKQIEPVPVKNNNNKYIPDWYIGEPKPVKKIKDNKKKEPYFNEWS